MKAFLPEAKEEQMPLPQLISGKLPVQEAAIFLEAFQ